MLNRSASLAMSTSVLKALPGKLDIRRHSLSILYLYVLQVFHERKVRDEDLLNTNNNLDFNSPQDLLDQIQSRVGILYVEHQQ